jgi:hypothetical protein
MNKYYISEISINNISHDIIEQLKNKYYFNTFYNNVILTENGFYKIIDNNIIPFNFNYHNNSITVNDFLKKYTLIKQSKNTWKKNNNSTHHIPFNHSFLNQTILQFKLNKHSNFSLNIVLNKNKIYDIYFLSNYSHDDFSFIEDISYFIRMFI